MHTGWPTTLPELCGSCCQSLANVLPKVAHFGKIIYLLPECQKISVYHIVQEQLNNANKLPANVERGHQFQGLIQLMDHLTDLFRCIILPQI